MSPVNCLMRFQCLILRQLRRAWTLFYARLRLGARSLHSYLTGGGELRGMWRSERARRLWIAGGLTIVLQACSNTVVTGLGNGRPPIEVGGSGSGSGLSLLSRVVPSNTDSSTTLDLVGDGSNLIGQHCMSESSTGSPISGSGYGPSTCQCVFDYTASTGTERIEVPTTYYEANLVRCRYDSIPSDASSVRVSLHITTTGTYSNSQTLILSGSGSTVSIDLGNSQSYVPVQRFQCRDFPKIPYAFQGSIYDPIQSEDTRYSYPLNFYATNLGGAALAFANKSNSNKSFYSSWECSTNPYEPAHWENLKIFSVGAGSGGSKLIHPNDRTTFSARSNFLLAKQKTGVFSVPFHALIGPAILTQEADSQGGVNTGPDAPLGYAAKVSSSGTGEACPASSILPAGYKWVKVWAFRGSLDPRWYVLTSDQADQTGGIACNAVVSNGASAAIFPDCGTGGTLPSGTMPAGLARRVLGNSGMCVERAGDAPAPYSSGTDRWSRRVTGGASFYPWELSSSTFDTTGDLGVGTDSALQLHNPDSGQSRYDYVFVTTPPSVTRSMMESGTGGANAYYPFTYKRAEDCPGASPDPDSDMTCLNNAARRTHYDLWTAKVSDAPSANGTGTVFPLCAVQPE